LSTSRSSSMFDLIHCDLWTSPIISISGFWYYIIIVDDYSHFYCPFPLAHKSDTSAPMKTFLSRLKHSSAPTFVHFKLIMALSFLTLTLILSYIGMALSFDCRVYTPHSRMVRLSELFVWLMTLCAPLCFTLIFLWNFGLKLSPPPHIFLIVILAKPLILLCHIDVARCWCKSPSSWEPQEEGMMSTVANFPSVRNQGLSVQ
jgi:hypothetical protein